MRIGGGGWAGGEGYFDHQTSLSELAGIPVRCILIGGILLQRNHIDRCILVAACRNAENMCREELVYKMSITTIHHHMSTCWVSVC